MTNELANIEHGISFTNDHLTSLATQIAWGDTDNRTVEQLDIIGEVVTDSMKDAERDNDIYLEQTGEQAPNYNHLVQKGTEIMAELNKIKDSYSQGEQ